MSCHIVFAMRNIVSKYLCGFEPKPQVNYIKTADFTLKFLEKGYFS